MYNDGLYFKVHINNMHRPGYCSGSLAEGEELENKAEKEETEEGTMEVKQELKKRRRKKKGNVFQVDTSVTSPVRI